MIKRLSDHVLYTPHDGDIDQPSLICIYGEKSGVIIDGGCSPALVNTFLDGLKEFVSVPIIGCVVTHWHWDHVFGLCGLDIPIIAHQNIKKHLKRMAGYSWDKNSIWGRVQNSQEFEFCYEHIIKVYGENDGVVVKQADILFESKLEIDLGGVICSLSHLSSDHSDDATAVYVEDDGVLIVGDAICPEYYAIEQFYSGKIVKDQFDFIKSLTWLKYVFESHLAPMTKEEFFALYKSLPVAAAGYIAGNTDEKALFDYLVSSVGEDDTTSDLSHQFTCKKQRLLL